VLDSGLTISLIAEDSRRAIVIRQSEPMPAATVVLHEAEWLDTARVILALLGQTDADRTAHGEKPKRKARVPE
jgi:hypothetical protein